MIAYFRSNAQPETENREDFVDNEDSENAENDPEGEEEDDDEWDWWDVVPAKRTRQKSVSSNGVKTKVKPLKRSLLYKQSAFRQVSSSGSAESSDTVRTSGFDSSTSAYSQRTVSNPPARLSREGRSREDLVKENLFPQLFRNKVNSTKVDSFLQLSGTKEDSTKEDPFPQLSASLLPSRPEELPASTLQLLSDSFLQVQNLNQI